MQFASNYKKSTSDIFTISAILPRILLRSCCRFSLVIFTNTMVNFRMKTLSPAMTNLLNVYCRINNSYVAPMNKQNMMIIFSSARKLVKNNERNLQPIINKCTNNYMSVCYLMLTN